MKYSYLYDKDFLKAMDEESFKEQYIRIFILDFKTEKVKASIEGKTTSGSCNLSGTSNMRRTASCSLVVDPDGVQVVGEKNPQQYYNITEVENLISLNKKVKIETGFTNTLKYLYPQYSQYDTIWYPLGTYVIKNVSVSRNNSGINISLTLNDKCALLNGDLGGVIPAATVFSELESFNSTGTQREVEKILIKDVIKSLVVEFGGESPDNVIISDIDDYIVRVVKWNGKTNAYLYDQGSNKRLVIEQGEEAGQEFIKGQDIGYTLERFVYPGTLECNMGETVASMLDKIRNTLGNFEWFYDLDGRFIFRQIKNYLNESISTNLLELQERDYLSTPNLSKTVYTFDNSNKHLVTSISNSPQYPNIKNDFIVWGAKKGVIGGEIPIRYHLAFDNKPTVNIDNERLALVYTDYRRLQGIIPLVNNYILGIPSAVQNKDLFYIGSDQYNNPVIYRYNESVKGLQACPEYKLCYLITDDWRTELYYLGLWSDNKTFAKNPYSAELNAEWPKIWQADKYLVQDRINVLVSKDESTTVGIPIYKGGYRDDIDKYDYTYWLDFLEGSQGGTQNISQFNINSIGRRTKVVNEKNINCLFAREFPNYIYIEASKGISREEQRVANQMGREAIQVSRDVYKNLSTGGNQNSAFDKIRELLYTYTQYNDSISLSVIPIYHLEPNTRISVQDRETGVNGDYLIKSISLPLTTNGTSNISATRCLERTF